MAAKEPQKQLVTGVQPTQGELVAAYAALPLDDHKARAAFANGLVVVEKGSATSESALTLAMIVATQLGRGYMPDAISDLNNPNLVAVAARFHMDIDLPRTQPQADLDEALNLIGAEGDAGDQPMSITNPLSESQMQGVAEALQEELRQRFYDQRTQIDEEIRVLLAVLPDEDLEATLEDEELYGEVKIQDDLGQARKRRGHVAPGTRAGVDAGPEDAGTKLLRENGFGEFGEALDDNN